MTNRIRRMLGQLLRLLLLLLLLARLVTRYFRDPMHKWTRALLELE